MMATLFFGNDMGKVFFCILRLFFRFFRMDGYEIMTIIGESMIIKNKKPEFDKSLSWLNR